MLAYSTVAHNTGVHVIRFERFCSPSLTNLAPLLAKDCRATGNCTSSTRAALCQPPLRPRQMFPLSALFQSIVSLVYPRSLPFAVNMISCFVLSLAVVAHTVLSRNANAHSRQAQVHTHLSSLSWMYGLLLG